MLAPGPRWNLSEFEHEVHAQVGLRLQAPLGGPERWLKF